MQRVIGSGPRRGWRVWVTCPSNGATDARFRVQPGMAVGFAGLGKVGGGKDFGVMGLVKSPRASLATCREGLMLAFHTSLASWMNGHNNLLICVSSV